MSDHFNDYWRGKIDAFFHDSPDKAIDIKDHGARARALASKHGFIKSEKNFDNASDHMAAAADRIPFPKYSSKKQTSSPFDGTEFHPFKHPLGGADYRFDQPFKTADEALEVSFDNRPNLMLGDERASFFALWRFWQNWSSETDYRFNFLPAETRMPDHTIWNHLSVTTALQGCGSEGPELMVFSIGPVQDFIAAARSTRDLWSGSYLLSYLVATAMCEIVLEYGPDHIISPNLRGQPIIDLLLCDEIWSKCNTTDQKSIAESLRLFDDPTRVLTPSLPNRFLAILPKGKGTAFAKKIEANLKKTFKDIAASVKEAIQSDPAGKELNLNAERFDRQVEQVLEVYWQCLPIPETYQAAKELISYLPAENPSIGALEKIIAATPVEDRDSRNFLNKDTASGIPSQPTAAWAGLYALADWLLAGTKNTRTYDAWNQASSWDYGIANNKDALNGKEETVINPPAEDQAVCDVERAVKAGEFMGASTLIKRFWHRSWLMKEHVVEGVSFEAKDFGMPNTHAIAEGNPFERNSDDEPGEGYYAILALDGDEMGKWLSGANAPKLKEVLSKEMVAYFPDVLLEDIKRPLNPSFHLQFSEMLGNFALLTVRFIVQAHNGRLIYAGGDDVLAMLPSSEALACAIDLRAAFRGEKEILNQITGFYCTDKEKQSADLQLYRRSDKRLFDCRQDGFIRLNKDDLEGQLYNPFIESPFCYDVMVPGPSTDVSVGIAIGHCKSPLQDLVKAAQQAEKRAKKGDDAIELEGRRAVAVSIFKRSGEIAEWQSRWDSGELELYQELLRAVNRELLSNRFPYRLEEFVTPYLPRDGMVLDPGFEKNCYRIVEHEFQNCLKQHSQESLKLDKILEAFERSFGSKSAVYLLHQLPSLLRTVAWSSKQKPLNQVRS